MKKKETARSQVAQNAGSQTNSDSAFGSHLISAQEMAHERLRGMIFCGALRAGQALRQETIASQLGLSRLPVREALNRLATEGVVEWKPRRGFYVTSLSPNEIEDIFEIRAMLEGRAGFLATEARNMADADEVDIIVDKLDAVLGKSIDLMHWATLNLKFHDRVYQSCGRKYLTRQIRALRDAVAPLIHVLAAQGEELPRAQKEHRQIARAFRAGDTAKVQALCTEHCAYTGRILKKLVNRQIGA